MASSRSSGVASALLASRSADSSDSSCACIRPSACCAGAGAAAAVFLAAVFLAAVFLAGAFLAGALVRADFFAAGFFLLVTARSVSAVVLTSSLRRAR
ncbi:hypothetical protein EUA94_08850 [Nocardioides zhouii]|uniref:Uncharacterized protein n=1 Tax=Nocardioides zhouii TaxID=1168729 RepID=A0A4Q2T3Z6_9ACTN|nr:hypothetical protein EUA94_08850 [Nocardioides zhouii]